MFLKISSRVKIYYHQTIFCYEIRRFLYSEENSFQNYLNSLYDIEQSTDRTSFNINNVLAIQPNVKWGPAKKVLTNPYLQLEELTSLIETIPHLRVCEKIILSTDNLINKTIFGKTKLEEVTEKLNKNPEIRAIFVGVSILKSQQRAVLERLWKKPVFDRYNIVIQIFKHYAKTKEAKLQIALAEIPYIKAKLYEAKSAPSGIGSYFTTDFENLISYNNDYAVTKDCTPWNERKEQLNWKEDKIKKEIELLKKTREYRRLSYNSSLPNSYPIIAIVGYTNSGKSSLIKSLTGDESIEPLNRLFATLDVSLHQGTLLYGEKVLYLDTIGFISDIPITLINAFQATLQDINRADLIVHIRDCSHPDMEAQNETVKKTLALLELKAGLVENIIEVYNKIDLLPKTTLDTFQSRENVCLTSTKNYMGLDTLTQKIHQVLMAKSGTTPLNLTVPMQHYSTVLGFLMKMNASIQSTLPSEDSCSMMLKTIVDDKTISIFKHNFGTSYVDNVIS